MRDEQNRRQAKACVHQRSMLAECGSQERRMEGEQYASACTCRHLNFVSMKLELVGLAGSHVRGEKPYKAPVYDLHHRIACESEMYRRETRSPHQQYDSTEVKSIAERCGGW
jgi:hypothetical protein